MPVSSTATLTPEPSSPACHARGAPTAGTLTSSDARTLPSSHTFRTGASGVVRSAQAAVACFLSTFSVAASIAGNVWVLVEPFGTAAVRCPALAGG